MFLHLLSKEEQETFLSIANELITVDGEVDKQELERIQNFTKEIYGDKEFNFKSYNELTNIDSIFESKEAKRICLIELIGLCYVDGVYCEKEREFIRSFAKKIKVNSDGLSQIENWVNDFVKVFNEGVELIKK